MARGALYGGPGAGLCRPDARRKPLGRTATVTFDDAYSGVFDYAFPILAALRLPATVFVVTDAAANREPFWWDHPVAAQLVGTPTAGRWLGVLRGDGRRILQELGITTAPNAPP